MTTHGRTGGGGPIIIDLGCLGVNTKGVARVLTALTPRLVALGPGRYRAVCSPAARPELGELGLDQDAYVVPRVSGAVWEQVVLPGACTRLGASSVYSFGECGAMWGPRQLLHVSEDPEVRWQREPTTGIRELTRRRYSRLLMNRSLARANVVVCTSATLTDLVRNHHLDPNRATVVPLGVDLDQFQPALGRPSQPSYFFTLASSDDRDRTELILRAFGRYRLELGGTCRLIVGGSLGAKADGLTQLVEELGISDATTFRGRLTDVKLAEHYAGALATVHASPDEGFGLQPLEAMASGSLLIATPATAVEEVTEGSVLLWVDPRVDSMADAMSRAEHDPGLVEKAKTLNRRRAESYSWDRTAQTLHALLVDMK